MDALHVPVHLPDQRVALDRRERIQVRVADGDSERVKVEGC
jgi:hypothetical protein